MILPMLAYDARGDLSVVPHTGQWVMEPKFDGWRWQVEVTEDGVRSFGGRNGCEYTGQARHIEQELFCLPNGTVLDGELVASTMGVNAPDVGTLLANGGEGLIFVVFDVLALGDTDLTVRPLRERRMVLRGLLPLSSRENSVTVAPQVPVDDALVATWIAGGFEGAVCKDLEALYRPGKRSRAFVKIKPQTTGDAVVTGYVMGKGASNKHLVGALKIRLDSGVDTTVGFECKPSEASGHIGRRIEFRHHGIQASGKPKHPVFARFREDLEPFDQVADDIRRLSELAMKPAPTLGQDQEVGDGSWVRNYGAMGDAKLLKVIGQLKAGTGDACDRVAAHRGSVELNITTAEGVARRRGLVA
jgi:ATP-dependent DNA ligase